MAKKSYTVTELTDDLDGGKADRTVDFAVNGTSYELDLNNKNAKVLDKVLAPYISAARKVRATRGRPATANTGGRPKSRTDLSAIREWAQANGYQVSSRGRVAQEIQDAYDAASK